MPWRMYGGSGLSADLETYYPANWLDSGYRLCAVAGRRVSSRVSRPAVWERWPFITAAHTGRATVPLPPHPHRAGRPGPGRRPVLGPSRPLTAATSESYGNNMRYLPSSDRTASLTLVTILVCQGRGYDLCNIIVARWPSSSELFLCVFCPN